MVRMATVERPSATQGGHLIPVVRDVTCLQLTLVNVAFVGEPFADDRGWCLVDAGMSLSAGRIRRAARQLYGDARPASVVLTHGHFDHVGSVRELADEWDCPVYAHELELPFLTGRSDYPPPDPTVGGGFMSLSSPLFSRAGIDLGDRVRPLPADNSVPGMPGWRWVHTPGHSPGHVSLFREADRTLIAGDAFVTTRQESLTAVLSQRPEVWRPPAYFTIDWPAAKRSVELLASLQPAAVLAGHGVPMSGADLRQGLAALARDFDAVVPEQGRYVAQPVVADRDGVRSVPPAVSDPTRPVLVGLGVAAVMLAVYAAARSANRS